MINIGLDLLNLFENKRVQFFFKTQ